MLGEIKRLISKAAHSLGYEVIPLWKRDGWPLATLTQQLFHLHKVDCVLDVGANRGQYADFLRQQVGFQGPIISFEPLPHLVDNLMERSHNDPHWTIQPYALGSTSEDKMINVMTSDTFSSFLNPTEKDFSDFSHLNTVEHQENVKIRTLSEVSSTLSSLQKSHHPFLKLDTQGYDLEVIEGTGPLLSKFVGLQTEVPILKIYEQMPDLHHVIDYLGNLGFDCAGIFPVSRDDHLRIVEFDLVLINRLLST